MKFRTLLFGILCLLRKTTKATTTPTPTSVFVDDDNYDNNAVEVDDDVEVGNDDLDDNFESYESDDDFFQGTHSWNYTTTCSKLNLHTKGMCRCTSGPNTKLGMMCVLNDKGLQSIPSLLTTVKHWVISNETKPLNLVVHLCCGAEKKLGKNESMKRNTVEFFQLLMSQMYQRIHSLWLSGDVYWLLYHRLDVKDNASMPHMQDLSISECSYSKSICGQDEKQDKGVNKELKTLKNSLLSFMPNLKILSISNTRNLTLEDDSFANLTKLARLALDKNGITTWPRQLFKQNTELRYLRLRNNKMELADMAQLFANTPNLIELDLSGNALKNFKHVPGIEFSSLKFLALNDNQLEHFEYLGTMSRLETLRLDRNNLRKVPDLSPFHNLNSLLLAGNNGINNPSEATKKLKKFGSQDKGISPILPCMTISNPLRCSPETKPGYEFQHYECECAAGYNEKRGTCKKDRTYAKIVGGILGGVLFLIGLGYGAKFLQERSTYETIKSVRMQLDQSLCDFREKSKDKQSSESQNDWEGHSKEFLPEFNKLCTMCEPKGEGIPHQPWFIELPNRTLSSYLSELKSEWGKVKEKITSTLESIAKGLNKVEFVMGSKDETRIAMKCVMKYNGHVELVRDCFRCRFSCDGFEPMCQALKQIQTKSDVFKIVRMKNRYKEEQKADILYRDCQILCEELTTHVIFEIQLRLKKNEADKTVDGHKEYEKFRRMQELDFYVKGLLASIGKKNSKREETYDEIDEKLEELRAEVHQFGIEKNNALGQTIPKSNFIKRATISWGGKGPYPKKLEEVVSDKQKDLVEPLITREKESSFH
eukprot:m.7867 g.7867  ORF g.7867 m.7867 type:complete len:821 (+) comp3795_c0_seq2:79-2541(+)